MKNKKLVAILLGVVLTFTGLGSRAHGDGLAGGLDDSEIQEKISELQNRIDKIDGSNIKNNSLKYYLQRALDIIKGKLEDKEDLKTELEKLKEELERAKKLAKDQGYEEEDNVKEALELGEESFDEINEKISRIIEAVNQKVGIEVGKFKGSYGMYFKDKAYVIDNIKGNDQRINFTINNIRAALTSYDSLGSMAKERAKEEVKKKYEIEDIKQYLEGFLEEVKAMLNNQDEKLDGKDGETDLGEAKDFNLDQEDLKDLGIMETSLEEAI